MNIFRSCVLCQKAENCTRANETRQANVSVSVLPTVTAGSMPVNVSGNAKCRLHPQKRNHEFLDKDNCRVYFNFFRFFFCSRHRQNNIQSSSAVVITFVSESFRKIVISSLMLVYSGVWKVRPANTLENSKHLNVFERRCLVWNEQKTEMKNDSCRFDDGKIKTKKSCSLNPLHNYRFNIYLLTRKTVAFCSFITFGERKSLVTPSACIRNGFICKQFKDKFLISFYEIWNANVSEENICISLGMMLCAWSEKNLLYLCTWILKWIECWRKASFEKQICPKPKKGKIFFSTQTKQKETSRCVPVEACDLRLHEISLEVFLFISILNFKFSLHEFQQLFVRLSTVWCHKCEFSFSSFSNTDVSIDDQLLQFKFECDRNRM